MNYSKAFFTPEFNARLAKKNPARSWSETTYNSSLSKDEDQHVMPLCLVRGSEIEEQGQVEFTYGNKDEGCKIEIDIGIDVNAEAFIIFPPDSAEVSGRLRHTFLVEAIETDLAISAFFWRKINIENGKAVTWVAKPKNLSELASLVAAVILRE